VDPKPHVLQGTRHYWVDQLGGDQCSAWFRETGWCLTTHALTAAMQQIADGYGLKTADFVAVQLEYPQP